LQVNVGGNTFLGAKYLREKFSFTDPEYFINADSTAKGFEITVFDPKDFSVSLEMMLDHPVSAIMSTTFINQALKQQQPYFKFTLTKNTDFSLLKYSDIKFLKSL